MFSLDFSNEHLQLAAYKVKFKWLLYQIKLDLLIMPKEFLFQQNRKKLHNNKANCSCSAVENNNNLIVMSIFPSIYFHVCGY